MKLIEVHILQHLPVSNVNRDSSGQSKEAMVGGVMRARVSSQCWNRAIREFVRKNNKAFGGVRTKYLMPQLKEALISLGCGSIHASNLSQGFCDQLGSNKEKKNELSSLVYLAPSQILQLAKEILVVTENDIENTKKAAKGKKGKTVTEDDRNEAVAEMIYKTAKKGFSGIEGDGIDIAIYGRMVANDPSCKVEGAAFLSHALSTHECFREFDYFTALDDLNSVYSEDSGSSHIGEACFNSACYYRYHGLNYDLFLQNIKQANLTKNEIEQAIRDYLLAVFNAVPTACQKSKFGQSGPSYILVTVREGSPLSMFNAFETPIDGGNGYIQPSIDKIQKYWEDSKIGYGLKTITEKTFILGEKSTTFDDLVNSVITSL